MSMGTYINQGELYVPVIANPLIGGLLFVLTIVKTHTIAL